MKRTKLHGFYEIIALQHLCPIKCNLCEQPLDDLYCPSSKDNDPEYVCAYCRKIFPTKALLKLHSKVTQHYTNDAVVEDKSEAKNVDKVEDAPVIPNGPCLISCMKVSLINTFETTHQ